MNKKKGPNYSPIFTAVTSFALASSAIPEADSATISKYNSDAINNFPRTQELVIEGHYSTASEYNLLYKHISNIKASETGKLLSNTIYDNAMSLLTHLISKQIIPKYITPTNDSIFFDFGNNCAELYDSNESVFVERNEAGNKYTDLSFDELLLKV